MNFEHFRNHNEAPRTIFFRHAIHEDEYLKLILAYRNNLKY